MGYFVGLSCKDVMYLLCKDFKIKLFCKWWFLFFDRMKFVDSIIWSFWVVKVFWENSDWINYIDFLLNGEIFIMSSDDDLIVIYDC